MTHPDGEAVFDNPDDPGAFWRPGWPKVQTRVVYDGRLAYLALDCPFCGHEHRHGGTDKPPETIPLGGRVSHCRTPHVGGSYVLLAPTYSP